MSEAASTIVALRNQEAVLAFTKLRAVADDVFAEAEPRRAYRKQRFQSFLAFDER